MNILRRSFLYGLTGLALSTLLACGGSEPAADQSGEIEPLTVGAIPDQDPEKVQRLYTQLSEYLEAELGVPVTYEPVTDYAAAVTAFRVGDLDLVWFGALTGVQARLQVEGAEAIAQRTIDEQFHSVFIANTNSGLEPIESMDDLDTLKGRSFTFGSESSTSGRLMPQYFMQQAGVTPGDFKGEVGFSGNHDATIKLVTSGTYEVGALNEQVWQSRLEAGAIDEQQVQMIWRTPAYYNYHWVVHPGVEERYGADFIEAVQAAILDLDASVPEEQAILDLFGAERFIETENDNYAQIEAVGREIGKIQ